MLDVNKIMEILPHRYPFLMVDRITEYSTNEYAVGYKNISVNEPWSVGHFKENPIFPGVLIIEAAAQVGGFIFIDKNSESGEVFGFLSSVDKVKFVKPVVPGDCLKIKATLINRFANIGRVKMLASVDGKRVAEGELTYVFSK